MIWLRRTTRARVVAVLAVAATLHIGCSIPVHRVSVTEQPALVEGQEVTTPVRAHLKDGRIALFRDGFTLSGSVLHGAAEVYDALLKRQGTLTALSLDEVVAFESYSSRRLAGESLALGVGGGAAALVAVAALAGTLFGSCPTVYSDAAVDLRLEAELFSYSIAPLFEGPDLDRLTGSPDHDGRLTLEIRNEALETHYINYLALVEVAHDVGERAMPDQEGRVAIVGGLLPVRRAADRRGRSWTDELRSADGRGYESPESAIRRAGSSQAADDLVDWIELEVEVSPGEGRPALVITARNSLLITVLFYERMLAQAGVRAIDWLGSDLERISTAAKLGLWISEYSGLRVELWRDGGWEPVARLPDPGPIAWREAAVELPPLPAGPARLRLAFLTDGWRLDAIAVGRRRTGPIRTLAPAEVRDADSRLRPDLLERLSAPDEAYLVTYPGQRFAAVFDVGPGSPGQERSFLLASQGHYVEWVRAQWIRRAGTGEPFEPTAEALRESLQRWSQVRSDFERDFLAARVPVP